ncbi:DUF481 domain-containing protein [Occallatibacter savannae]|uniref:DUF481 domain-containing protein n=1 Tax=Occallatibacter savannae TaxID=1002691 RepID=UPI000D695463|nr:DUF481 domain-containing protein [Occallatibacter savannae]
MPSVFSYVLSHILSSFARARRTFALLSALLLSMLFSAIAHAGTDPDVLVLNNGDTLHGKLVNSSGGSITFHSDALGDLSVGWDKIKELRTTGSYAVIDKTVRIHSKKNAGSIPEGQLEVADKSITVHSEKGAAPAPIPVANAQYIMDAGTLDKQLYHQPGFFTGWNGAATAGAAIVTATENQYTFSGGIGLVRLVPTVSWLTTRDRTSIDFLGSFGKITQPSYTDPVSGIVVPAVVTKSAIYHADAERDQYFSPRFFALAQTAFDHNYGQDLELQQIYGGGFGWTFLKTPKQEADLKATIQYEKQQFISSGSANENLIGSTISLTYILHHKFVTYTQGLAYIPAFNNPHAYSANETNTLAFPAYKNFSFSLGTLDSYLNNPPASLPPTKRNSFQFTMGMTYAIKSKY